MSWQTDFLKTLAVNHPELNNSGFAHLANVGDLKAETLFDLGDGLRIRKALQNEVSTLHILADITRSLSPLVPTRNPYETQSHSESASPDQVSYTTIDLPVEKWKYHVIDFVESNVRLHDFVQASVLTRTRLELGPTVMAIGGLGGTCFTWCPTFGRLWNELRLSDESFLSLASSDLEDLRNVHQKVTVFDNDIVNLRGAIKQYVQLDEIPKSSPLRFLGYVSVLESLITHAPDSKDPYDSLTRQVRQKMLLIGRRCLIPIPYATFASDVNQDTLWTRLYEYRSAIAHGATPDFSGRLSCLKSASAALTFLASATTSVMRQALEEPELLADLRSC
jgi:hypothetical protein